MILAKRTFRRPSIDIPWFFNILDKSEFISRYNEIYLPHLVFDLQDYDNPLVAKFLVVWDTIETHNNYKTDPILSKFWTLRDQYNEEMGVTVESYTVEEINDINLAVF
jgi:hypothetical protein